MIPPQNQRSASWLKWRRHKLGASDASAIMGTNSFTSIGALWDEKLGLRAPQEENAAMARGNALEDEARSAFELETGYVMFPQVCIHPEYPWMIASLDGMTIEKDVAVEIKCPGMKVSYETFTSRKVPEYYYAQLQHQMAVTGLNEIYFYSYCPKIEGEEINFTTSLMCFRDQPYIDKLLDREKRFYELLVAGFAEISNHEHRLDMIKNDLYKILEG